MSVPRSPRLTLALFAANRRNAQKSTGPKTARGKTRSRLNGLHTGSRSKELWRLNQALAWCAPADIRATAATILTPEQLEHPFSASHIRAWEEIWEMGIRRATSIGDRRRRSARVFKNSYDQSRNLL